MARTLVLVLFAMTMLGSRTAEAIGPCENTPLVYEPPLMFSEKEQAFAIPATQYWCEESTVGNEVRGDLKFVELRDVNDIVIGRLSIAHGQVAKRLEQAVGAFEAVPAGKLAATLKARGYAPLAATGRGKARCAVRTATTAAPKETVNGFPAERGHVEVVSGGKLLVRLDDDLTAEQRHDDFIVRAHFLAQRAAIAVWVQRPSCAGPPPGYWGPDSLGDCYPINNAEVLVLEVAKLPALAACFATTP